MTWVVVHSTGGSLVGMMANMERKKFLLALVAAPSSHLGLSRGRSRLHLQRRQRILRPDDPESVMMVTVA